MKIDIVKKENGIILIEHLNKMDIIIEESVLPDNSDRKFEFIKYEPVEIIDNDINIRGILIKFQTNDYIEDIFSILSKRKDDDFHRIFIDLNSLFKFKKEVSWEEFRGYVGEALFLHNIGGVRTKNDSDTFDIFLNGNNMIEVKTFSNQKKTITVSHEQIVQGTKLFAVPLIPEENGISIMELSDEISDREFGLEIKGKFKDSVYSSYKFRNTTPEEIKWRPEVDNKLPKGIVSATYNMNIDKPK